MGADIYLPSVHKANEAKWQDAFYRAADERDRYNRLPHFSRLNADPYYDALQDNVEFHFRRMNAPDGYFRDSYNPGSLLQAMGMSWWRDIIPMLDDDSRLPIDNAHKLYLSLQYIGKKNLTLPMVTEYMASKADMYERGYDPAVWLKEWQEALNQLLDLLNRSIVLNEPLECSL